MTVVHALAGELARSCVMTAAQADKTEITTIEGVATGTALHPVQEALLADGVLQCGYCTPGMVLAAIALLEKNPRPSEQEIVAWMDAHLCRCCAYPEIVRAIQRAADQIAEAKAS